MSVSTSLEMRHPFRGSHTRYIYLMAMLLALSFPTVILGQESPVQGETQNEEQARKEAAEVTSDLRDSVTENLGTIVEHAETADELQKAQQEKQPPPETTEAAVSEQIGEIELSEEAPVEKEIQKKTLADRFKAIPAYLQSVPDRLPFIRDRGLIFFGRSEFDYAHYGSGITKSDSGFRLRSLRAGLAKAYKFNLSVKAEVDLTDGDSSFADLYVRYNHKRYGLFTIGNQRIAQALVNQSSRVSNTFMEEPLPAEAFGLSRRLALGWDLHRNRGGFHLTAFGPDLNGSIGDSGFAGRVYFNPTRDRFNLFHIGASMVSENMSRKTRFYAHPESRITSERLVDTGIYDDVKYQNITALEIAGARDSFMFRSEYFRASWHRKTLENAEFSGYYLQASWVLTGEAFNYQQGKFIRIRTRNLRGAWETALRLSKINLNDTGIFGGEERNLSAAINWYAPGNQLRIMCNLIFVETDKYAGNESPTIFQLRAQFHW